jgi:hypothetical protein
MEKMTGLKSFEWYYYVIRWQRIMAKDKLALSIIKGQFLSLWLIKDIGSLRYH